MDISSYQIQNSRPYQEDRYFIRPLDNDDFLLGMFDGHGGSQTSEFLKNRAPNMFQAIRKCYPSLSPEETFQFLFARLNEKIWHSSGSTASIVWIDMTNYMAHIAILGDSPVFIFNRSISTLWKSPEHNIRSNYDESNDALMRGGVIYNGYLYDPNKNNGGGLQMSRAFGDRELENVLNREPEIFSIPIEHGDWLLSCTDGLLDPGHTHGDFSSEKYLIDAINESDSFSAIELVRLGAGLDCHDNSTAILARI